MNTLTALKRCSLGLDLYLWLVYRYLRARRSVAAHLARLDCCRSQLFEPLDGRGRSRGSGPEPPRRQLLQPAGGPG